MDLASPPHSLVPPHGGTLNERLAPPALKDRLEAEIHSLPSIPVDKRTLSDLKLFAVGALSPLKGFMTRRRFLSVVRDMRLETGLVWSIPITLPIDDVVLKEIGKADRVALVYEGRAVAVMDIEDAFQPNKVEEAINVYGVDEPSHPGVKAVYERGDHYLGGPVTVFDSVLQIGELLHYQLTPRETRALFAERGWKTVVAFQTRNPIHRAHEYLQKCALEMVDGLFIHPLVGETKSDDLDALTRFRCYERIIEAYYPTERVALAAFPASMRYAGPREAIFHALCRKNYGCTHFIVGRDHAGVGNYYGTYDAQEIFDRFDPDEIGIQPLKFEHAFYCRTCDGMASGKTCPHPSEDHVILSGTKVRQMLREGVLPPPQFSRPEIAQILIEAQRAAAPVLPGRDPIAT